MTDDLIRELVWCANLRYELTSELTELFDWWFEETYGFVYGYPPWKKH